MADGTTTNTGAGTGSGTQQPPATPPGGTSGAGPSGDWTTGLADDLRGVVQVKGWKDAGAVVDAYRKLETHLGTPADRLLSLPKDPNDTKAMEAVWARLGRPEKADGYELELPEGADQEFAGQAAGWFHAAGLTKSQGQAVVKAWNAHQAQQAKAAQEAAEQQRVADEADIREAFGPRYNEAIGVAKQAVAAFVKDQAVIDQLAGAMGQRGVVELFEAIGRRMGEAKAKGFEQGAGDGVPSTAEGVKAKIAELKADRAWVQKYLDGDKSARAELDRLQKTLVDLGG